jgi:hypothetical protein
MGTVWKMGLSIVLPSLWAPLFAACCTFVNTVPPDYRPTFSSDVAYRAVSLKRLQQIVSSDPKNHSDEKIRALAGMTEIHGFIIDDKSGDIIIHGWADPSMPSLCLDDFVVALRNAWFRYAPVSDDTIHYSSVGCSIDPDPVAIERMRRMEPQLSTAQDTVEAAKLVAEWVRICKTPQSVRVLGMPFDCHIAKTLVDADYHMKTAVDGSDTLGIPGVVSYVSRMFDDARNQVLARKPIRIVSSQNRFWFFPGKTEFESDGRCFMLTSCEVKLLSELQYANMAQSATIQDDFAARFARDFTANFDRIAEIRPIYRELEGCFRLMAVADELHSRVGSAGSGLEYLLDRYPLSETKVQRNLPGRHSIRTFHREWEEGDVGYLVSLRQPSCGGVDIRMSPVVLEAKTGAIGAAIVESRTATDALSWDCPQTTLGRRANGKPDNRLNCGNSTLALEVRSEKDGYSILKDGSALLAADGRSVFKDMSGVSRLLKDRAKHSEAMNVILALNGFTTEKADAFESSLRLQALVNGQEGAIHLVPIVAADSKSRSWTLEMVLSPGIRYKTEEPAAITTIKEGKFEKYVSSIRHFAVRIGQKSRELSLQVLAKRQEIVDRFISLAKSHVSKDGDYPGSIADLTAEIRRDLLKSDLVRMRNASGKALTEDDVILMLKDEFGNTQCVLDFTPHLSTADDAMPICMNPNQ